MTKRYGRIATKHEEKNMNGQNEDREQKYVGLAVGAGFGVVLGLVFVRVLNHPGFFALGIGIGISIGFTIGVALDER
jgi:ElaB/YqjD/DUF883 family membrane-anchored ribosome-binding protein